MADPRIRDMALFLAFKAVPLHLRGRWWVRLAERQMRRWHPDLADKSGGERPVSRHGYADSQWGGIVGWRTVCACRQGFDDAAWHVHAHEQGVDPHGRHHDGATCPCATACEVRRDR